MSGVGPTLTGRNGEGDAYRTDGDIHIAVLSPGAVAVAAPPVLDADPIIIQGKNAVWAGLAKLLAPEKDH